MECRSARYAVLEEVFAGIRDGIRADEGESRLLAVLARVGLLVLDELKLAEHTEFEARKLTSLLDARYRDNRPTVLAGNLTVPEAQVRLGDSVWDRIHETGGVITMEWDSFRRQP